MQLLSAETAYLIKNKQPELENLYSECVNGIINRSCATWMEKGEKCTAHFLRLEKKLFFPVNYNQTLSVHQQLSFEGEILEGELLD